MTPENETVASPRSHTQRHFNSQTKSLLQSESRMPIVALLVDVVCPIIGCVLTICMFMTPLPAVLRMVKKEDLGELNPLPWVAAFLNCAGFTGYAIIRKDFYIFLANVPGLMLAMFYTLSAISVLSQVDTSRNRIMLGTIKSAVILGLLFWSVVGMIAGLVTRADAAIFVGSISAFFAIVYYAAPLSTAVQVVTNQDASSLYTPMIMVNLLNALMWIFYGSLGINQAQVWVPNAIGAVLAIAQLSLIGIYPSTEETQPLRPQYRPVAQVSPASFVRRQQQASDAIPVG